MLGEAAAAQARNFFFRVAGGILTESAEGTGSEWNSTTARFTLSFNTSGRLLATMNSDLASGKLGLDGQMDDALVSISGTYTFVDDLGDLISGPGVDSVLGSGFAIISH